MDILCTSTVGHRQQGVEEGYIPYLTRTKYDAQQKVS